MADIEPGLRLHYVTAGQGPATVVLLHGFPQTWWEWRKVMPTLVEAGCRVVAPDYRGAGHSSRPADGYDKRTMAGDVQRLLRQHLDVSGQVILVGHDIGLMVAYAYARAYRDEVSHLAVVDAPLPGTTVFDRLRTDPRVWHFAFHAARDVAEMLVAGRERPYLRAFFDVRIFNPFAKHRGNDMKRQRERASRPHGATHRTSAPGAMRAGFELYRAFDRDADENRASLQRNGKLTIPVLAVGGTISTSGSLVAEMMREVAINVTEYRVPQTAHWVPEENASAFSRALLEFLNA